VNHSRPGAFTPKQPGLRFNFSPTGIQAFKIREQGKEKMMFGLPLDL
jgi:hypothetical protein